MLRPYLIILFWWFYLVSNEVWLHKSFVTVPLCSLRVIMIREFNFVPLENQAKITEFCDQFPVGINLVSGGYEISRAAWRLFDIPERSRVCQKSPARAIS